MKFIKMISIHLFVLFSFAINSDADNEILIGPGVTTLNEIDGNVTLTAGDNISIENKTTNIVISGTAQIQSDWDEINETKLSFIKNKPIKLSDFENDPNYITSDDIPSISWEQGEIAFTSNKIGVLKIGEDSSDIYAPAPLSQVQANWDETNDSSPSFIQNKPEIPTVNNATFTITNGNNVVTFYANDSTNKSIKIDVGDTIEWTQNQESGTQIATLKINNGPDIPIYVPTITSGSTVNWVQTDLNSTNIIGKIIIDNVESNICIPYIPTNVVEYAENTNGIYNAIALWWEENAGTSDKNIKPGPYSFAFSSGGSGVVVKNHAIGTASFAHGQENQQHQNMGHMAKGHLILILKEQMGRLLDFILEIKH